MNREQVCTLPGGQKPRVCVISYWNDKYAPLAEIVRPNWKRYCEKHGYALRFYPGEYHEDTTRPQTFGDKGKFRLYYDVRGHCDIVMFLDIDSLFMNHDIRVEDVVGFGRFFWTFDANGPLSGLWIAKTDEITESHLRHAYERAAIENNVRHGKIEPNGISDQDSLRDIMNVPPFKETFRYCLDAKEWGHCYPENYEPGKWIVTFPGMSVEQKLEGMKKYAGL